MTLSSDSSSQALQMRGILLVAGAALLFSAKAVFVKLAYRHGIEPVNLMTLRMLFSLPVYSVIALYSLRTGGGARLDLALLFRIGVLGLLGYYLASILDLSGLQYITANLERLILYIYPSLVLLISAVALGRPIQRAEIFCLLGAYAGIAIVFGTDLGLDNSAPVKLGETLEVPSVLWGGLLVLASALSFAFYLVGSEHSMRVISPTLFTSLAMLSSTLAICVHFAFTQPMSILLEQSMPIYGLAFCIAIVSTVLPSYMIAAGIQRISAARAGIISTIGPISTMAMGAIFLGELVTPMHLLGLGTVALSSLALSRVKR